MVAGVGRTDDVDTHEVTTTCRPDDDRGSGVRVCVETEAEPRRAPLQESTNLLRERRKKKKRKCVRGRFGAKSKREQEIPILTETVGGWVMSGPSNGLWGGRKMYPDPTTAFGFCDVSARRGVERERGQRTKGERSGRCERRAAGSASPPSRTGCANVRTCSTS